MSVRQIRKNKHKRTKRNSVGILIIYKETLHKYITEHNKEVENIFWLKIDTRILGLEKNLFLGITYVSPIYSSIYNTNPHMKNTFECLKKQLASFNKDDLIILGGDFNARTGNLKDFILDDNINNYVTLPEFYKSDTFARERINQDKIINKFGEELRELCISTNLKILNGRTLGDLTGQFTYICKNGCSTVDYILASEDIMTDNDIITYFKVANLNHLSDHRLTRSEECCFYSDR